MQKQLVRDVNHLLKQGVAPGQIVLIIDGQKRESRIADLKKIGKHKIKVACSPKADPHVTRI